MSSKATTSLKRKRSTAIVDPGVAESSAQALARQEDVNIDQEMDEDEEQDLLDENEGEDENGEYEDHSKRPISFPINPKSSKPLPPSLFSNNNPLNKKPKKNAPSPGIIYISRLPPGMTPQKVKHLMSQWGEIGKVYASRREQSDLTSSSSKSNKKSKHQQANFSEAWVEFLDKKYAKVAAEVMNAEVIGGKKGDKWRDDIWTMKYLSGFRWEMLGEQVAHERQAHSSRLRQELSKSRLEQSEYLRNVELARVLEKRKARKEAASGAGGGGSGAAKIDGKTEEGGGGGGKGGLEKKGQRGYRQREMAGEAGKGASDGGEARAGKGQGKGKGGSKVAGANGGGGASGDAMSGVLANLF